jgi:DNA-binding beta-propeller fold protein YncE
MKNLKFTLLSALLLIALTASLRAEFLYVSYGKGLLSFSINRDTGALTKLLGTPTLFAEGAGSLTLDHTGKLLYVSTGSGIHGYRIASNGQLIPLPGSPYKVAGGELAVDPFNRFLYAGSGVYRIEPNGSLRAVPGSPFGTGYGHIAVDPFGRFIYLFSTQTIAVYSVLENGALRPVPGSPFSTGQRVDQYAVGIVAEKTGHFIYIATDLESSISTYQVAANGSLTQVPGSGAVVGGPWCESLAYNPVGGYLYLGLDEAALLDSHINPVTGLPETPAGYSLWTPSTGILENRPVGIAVSPTGKFVYVGNANVDVDPSPMTLRGFKVGPTGLLTLVPGSPYLPLGNNLDPTEVPAEEGWPSSMVVAP